MACKTCDHTMQNVNNGQPPVFWCPRCGTLKSKGMVPEFQAPKTAGLLSRWVSQVDRGDLDGVDLALMVDSEEAVTQVDGKE